MCKFYLIDASIVCWVAFYMSLRFVCLFCVGFVWCGFYVSVVSCGFFHCYGCDLVWVLGPLFFSVFCLMCIVIAHGCSYVWFVFILNGVEWHT